MRKALARIGVSEEISRLCDIRGCYEYCPQSDYQTGMKYVNLIKPLEYALHEGHDGVTGVFCGEKSPGLAHYETFEESVKLPTTIDAKKSSAQYKHGVLTVKLAKSEAEKNEVHIIEIN